VTVACNGGVAVVDDEVALADLIMNMLQIKNIPVSFKAYDAIEALQKFKECNTKPSIIIMDYRMPTMNGIEVMKAIQHIYNGVKFIFLSADSGVKEEALEEGAAMFLVKPVSMKDLISSIEQVAGK
jgi:two-component system, chemotaxis family, chemotaxis protein CheY